MILERHLRALLKRLGIDEHSPPEIEQWVALLAHLNDRLRHFEDDKHRLQRSLEIHGRELQTLYRELVTERDQLSSALACLPEGFIIFDRRGAVALMNAEAEQWLDLSEYDLTGSDCLSLLGLDQVLQIPDLHQRLLEGHPVAGRGFLRSKNSRPFLSNVHLQPVIREGKLAGTVLTFEPPQLEALAAQADQPHSELQSLITQIGHLIGHPESARIQGPLRNLLGQAQEALATLADTPRHPQGGTLATPITTEPTQEDLVAVPTEEPVAAAPPLPEPKAQPLPPKLEEPPTPPKPAPRAASSAPKTKSRTPRSGGLRILLVDNEVSSQQSTHTTVEQLGHDCTVVGSSEDGLRLHLAEPFDAIISAYRMEGLDGIELCRKVRENPQGGYPYFILLTAMDKREEATRALEAGVDAFLTKPLDPSELAVRLKVARGVQTRLHRVYSEFASGGEV